MPPYSRVQIKCRGCQNLFFIRKSWAKNRKFCTHACRSSSEEWKEICRRRQMGKKHSQASREKMKKSMQKAYDEGRHPNLKGSKVGYNALHTWARKKLGQPIRCAFCGTPNRKISDGRNYLQCANISHKYKREEKDWMYLCRKCHKKYDKPFYGASSKVKSV